MEKYYTIQDLIDILSKIEDKSKYVMFEYHDDVMYHWEHINGWYEENDNPVLVFEGAGLYKGPYSE